MLRRMLFITAVLISLCCLIGCEEESNQTDTEQEEVVKTAAEYQAEADEEITLENMENELKKIEDELKQELSEKE
jgi:hypothetical protein